MAANVLPCVAAAPSTMLRMVPLPRFAGEDGGGAFPPPLAGEGDRPKAGGGGGSPDRQPKRVTEESR